MTGAAFAAAVPGVPSWTAGFQEGNGVGGVIAAALSPAGGFGKFLLVVLAVSTSSACAPTLYSFGEYSLIRCCKIGISFQSSFNEREVLILFDPF